jgi:hypothetical protein
MNGGDDWLRAVLEDIVYGLQIGLLDRFAKLGNVGTGDEGPTSADEDDRLDQIVRRELPKPFVEGATHPDAERIHRW